MRLHLLQATQGALKLKGQSRALVQLLGRLRCRGNHLDTAIMPIQTGLGQQFVRLPVILANQLLQLVLHFHNDFFVKDAVDIRGDETFIAGGAHRKRRLITTYLRFRLKGWIQASLA